MKKIKGFWFLGIVIFISLIWTWTMIRKITKSSNSESESDIVDYAQAENAPRTDSTVIIGENQPSSSEVQESTQNYKIGDLIKFKDSEWIIVRAWNNGQTLKANNIYLNDALTEGKFITICFKVKNITNKEVRILDTPKLIDSQGREYKEYDHQTMYIPENAKDLEFEALPPDITKEFYSIFEVPTDAKNLKFQALALVANGDIILVNIGF